jgi:hypothetical protein
MNCSIGEIKEGLPEFIKKRLAQPLKGQYKVYMQPKKCEAKETEELISCIYATALLLIILMTIFQIMMTNTFLKEYLEIYNIKDHEHIPSLNKCKTKFSRNCRTGKNKNWVPYLF